MSENVYCDQCGTKLKASSRFCSGCGIQIEIVDYRRINPAHEFGEGQKIRGPETSHKKHWPVILVSVTLTISLVIAFTLFIGLSPTRSSPPSNTTSGSSGGRSTSTRIIWLSKAVTGEDVVSGPGVISGDFDVNGISVKDGVGNIGTVIVLLDGAQYQLSGPNSGTLYYPSNGQASFNDLTDKADAIVQDQRTQGCQGGCVQSKVVYFERGSQSGSAQYK